LKFCDAKEAAQKAAKMVEQYNSQTIQHATSPQEGDAK